MGKFIVLEGITSTGKTTQGKMLMERLRASGVEAFFNHEPTKHTPFGRLTRCLIEKGTCRPVDISRAKRLSLSIPLRPVAKIVAKIRQGGEPTELERQMLYIADRHEDLRGTVGFALSRGLTCVQDRYELSTYAFAATKNISYGKLKKLHDKILHDVYLVPDVLLYFDLDPETAIARLTASGKPVDVYETLPKIKKTQAAYEKLLKKKELYRTLHVIDARPPLDEVFGAICLKLNL